MSHTAQHRPFLKKVMVWGCFSFFGTGRLAVIQGTMTAAKYKLTLDQYLLPQIDEWYGGEEVIFQQDNAPCHKAASVKSFLEDREISTMQWPPYSPDLSPIENLWAILKRKLHVKSLTSVQQLTNHLTDLWANDPQIKATCEALIEGMPRRIQACIDAKGGPIKY